MTKLTTELVDRLWRIAEKQWRFDDHRQLDAWRVPIPKEVKFEVDFSAPLDGESAVINTVEFRREFGIYTSVSVDRTPPHKKLPCVRITCQQLPGWKRMVVL